MAQKISDKPVAKDKLKTLALIVGVLVVLVGGTIVALTCDSQFEYRGRTIHHNAPF